ncbi:hypothetical protein DFJ67_1062 [Asanoa ferruginea]|uniref:Uncharacterized protein n=1 Tax=Asanoa ferruginea TaxID=53367 RepID=A0A3D9ZF78_9ACTN|nr:hypothetical protein [Asanoa ferruginea]REF95112.1 hypothetical protein DFJ67_1062 [Asanoa ferruginea]GIF52940.1 hypothetical protein Afe04nite_74790 [Asanoa ferruginea]
MLSVAGVLAVNNFGDTREGGLAGPTGLFLIILLGTATVLLIRNMNKRLKRLPERFPGQDDSVVDPTVAKSVTAKPAEPIDRS